MKALARLLMTILSLAVLAACTSTPKPTGAPGPTETAVLTRSAVTQPAKPRHPPTSASPTSTSTNLGHLSPALQMHTQRAAHTATLLPNGQVLIAGGDSARNTPQLIAEIYDPATNTFTQSGRLHDGRFAHSATLLPDGNVLIAGGRPRYDNAGVLASAELYSPTTGEFIYTGSMNMARYKHAAVLLQDKNVLLIGGSNQNDWIGKYTSAEIYNTVTGTFTQIADMNSERFKLADAAVLLPSGDVLIGGGSRQIELFDAQTQHFLASATIDDDYYYSALTLLQDGRVLITGGYNATIRPSEKAWIYSYN